MTTVTMTSKMSIIKLSFVGFKYSPELYIELINLS